MIETEHSVSLFHDHVIRTIRIQPCCLNATKRAPQHQSGGCRHASHLPNMGTNGPMGPMPNLVKNLCSWKTISTFNRIPPNSSSDITIVACQHVSMSACQHASCNMAHVGPRSHQHLTQLGPSVTAATCPIQSALVKNPTKQIRKKQRLEALAFAGGCDDLNHLAASRATR